jgi:hypothetical protein
MVMADIKSVLPCSKKAVRGWRGRLLRDCLLIALVERLDQAVDTILVNLL